MSGHDPARSFMASQDATMSLLSTRALSFCREMQLSTHREGESSIRSQPGRHASPNPSPTHRYHPIPSFCSFPTTRPALVWTVLALKDVIGEDPDDYIEEETPSLMGLASDVLAVPEHTENWTVVGSSVSTPALTPDSERCLDRGDIAAGIAADDTNLEDHLTIDVGRIQGPEKSVGICSGSLSVSGNNVGLPTAVEDAVDQPSISPVESSPDGSRDYPISRGLLTTTKDVVDQPSINTIESSPDGQTAIQSLATFFLRLNYPTFI
ncbi:hypothetical protein BD779DRAFT_197211 [Infundibulicybe gibba]|nr:hypothetical protein BD779DRAFT_197211 [Infundibulicybe gibba]